MNQALPIINENELLSVQKPAQYLGGEIGSVCKSDDEVDIHFCLAFPDTYEVGMSHVGYQILYDLLNRDPKTWAERAYTPLGDMENLLRKKGAPLRSLEGKRPLCDFDVVGFSLQYELCMNGILTMMDLGRIPLLQKDRKDGDPLVIGGGPVAYHAEPFADFFDCFFVGDGEDLVPQFVEKLKRYKAEGLARKEILERLTDLKGVYVPSFFKPLYSETGAFRGFESLREGYEKVERNVIPSLEDSPFPRNPLVPNVEAVHDRLSVEVMRGCVRGCRFCQAGYLYRPQRERNPEEIKDIVSESLKNSGFEELSLLSLSTADYCSILPLLKVLKEEMSSENELAISFPSTRVDALKPELLAEVQPIRRSGFTMAPEAGTQRLRDVINKGVTDEQIMQTCSNVFKLGWNSVKLYFMIGLPTETDEDVEGIIDIGKRVKQLAGRKNQVTVSVSSHVPKPHTPFQWAEQIPISEIIRKQRMLSEQLKRHRIVFRYHDAESTFLEGVFARGDRALGQVILKAYELGARLDGWVEELRFDRWMEAFEEVGIDPHHYLHERSVDTPLPWDHISCDIPKRWFEKEWKRARATTTTPDCLNYSCSTCGACNYDDTRNVLFSRQGSEERLGIVNPRWNKIISGEITLEEISSEKTDVKAESTGEYQLKDYLRTEVDTRSKLKTLDRENRKAVQRLRVRYEKYGKGSFFAHLELARIFFRASRRAALPLVFSQGFNPRPKFAFGAPLQLGIESPFEYVDMFFYERRALKDVANSLNTDLPEGLRVLEVVEVELKAPSVQSLQRDSSYRAEVLPDSELDEIKLAQSLKDFPSLTIKRTKKGKTKELPAHQFSTVQKASERIIEFTISPDELQRMIKPFELLEGLTGLSLHDFRVQKTHQKLAEQDLNTSVSPHTS